MAPNKVMPAKNVRNRKQGSQGLKKLSKAGEWALANPNGLDVVHINWKAVLR